MPRVKCHNVEVFCDLCNEEICRYATQRRVRTLMPSHKRFDGIIGQLVEFHKDEELEVEGFVQVGLGWYSLRELAEAIWSPR